MGRPLVFVALLCSACGGGAVVPDGGGCPSATDEIAAPAPHTPRWAFEPWLSKDISDTDDSYAFVDGTITRDIPVGALVLDSPWETHYTTFVPNPVRYHDFDKLSTDLHARGVKLVLWTTQMVNTTSTDFEPGGDTYEGASPNFDEGLRCGFYVNQGDTYLWWKGVGAGVDFTNPAGVAWWHRQQDRVLPFIDGWKLDFGDSYVIGDSLETAKGTIAKQAYSEAYYHDFLAYGVATRGREFATMVRGWDASYGFKGRFYARPEDAPVVWAGDNRRDPVGFADALDTMFRSARAGYVVVGSDLGGYLDIDDKTFKPVAPDWDVFARWTAVSAVTPFFQLHGRANLTPWTLPDRMGHDGEMLALYRYWATLHHELVPFFYSLAEEAWGAADRKDAIVRPVGDEGAWAGDFRFLVGEALLVAPLLDGEQSLHTRDVALPAGAKYVDWWDLAAAPRDGGTTIAGYAGAVERPRVPLFLREGAIVPLAVSSSLTGLGTAASAGSLTVLVYPGAKASRFVLHDEDDAKVAIDASEQNGAAEVKLARAPRKVVLIVRREAAPLEVLDGGQPLVVAAGLDALLAADSGWYYDAAAKRAWVRIGSSAGARTITLR